MTQPVKVLTIAGSDSGGAAGLQADLKTFTALGVYGMSAVTVVTAQNSVRVSQVHVLPADFVAAQMEAVLQDYGAAAIKTGFVGSAGLVEAVADILEAYRERADIPLVVDPVLVNHRGEAMFGEEVVEAYRRRLLPGCTIVTPNRREAALLCERPVQSWAQVCEAAERLGQFGAQSVCITGARRDQAYGDALWDGRQVTFMEAKHIATENTHGSGDTLSAAIAAFMGQGVPLPEAVQWAQAFTARAIRRAVEWRMGRGHGPLGHVLGS